MPEKRNPKETNAKAFGPWLFSFCAGVLTFGPGTVAAQSGLEPTLGQFGTPGLIDMPTAQSRPDGTLDLSLSHFAGSTRTSLTFQFHPRISGTFRYTHFDHFSDPDGEYYDRSFDLHYRFLDEGRYRPAMAIGLRDFVGTGLYSSQYVVASKTIGSNLIVTGGLGWGRLSDSDETQDVDFGRGGSLDIGSWFSGPVGVFGGIEWQTPVEGLRFKAEYSSDRYANETEAVPGLNVSAFERNSPFNFGLTYTTKSNLQFGLNYLYGAELAASVSFSVNPSEPFRGRRVSDLFRPVPVRVAPPDPGPFGGDASQARAATYTQQIQRLIDKEITIVSSSFRGNTAELRIINRVYSIGSRAVEQTARAMTQVLPARYSNFDIVVVENELPVSKVTLDRRNIEAATGPKDTVLRNAQISEASPIHEGGYIVEGHYPRFSAAIAPYLEPSLFDPDNPLRADLRLGLFTDLTVARGLSFNSQISVKLLGNNDGNTRDSNSVLPRVRSDINLYHQNNDFTIDRLTVDYMMKFSPNVYGRVNAGIFEQMYGGVSGEVLWKPFDSPFALGAEVAWVQQRDFDQQLDFRDYSTVTGHISGYWDMGHGFYGQVDVGRYLAEDWGTTLSLQRVFDNNWRVGAFATFTDVSSEDFGEGSFDKGIMLTIPFGWATGKATRRTYSTVIRPVTRDGGARVSVPNRLYGIVSQADKKRLDVDWREF